MAALCHARAADGRSEPPALMAGYNPSFSPDDRFVLWIGPARSATLP